MNRKKGSIIPLAKSVRLLGSVFPLGSRLGSLIGNAAERENATIQK